MLSMRRIILLILLGFSFCFVVNNASIASEINIVEENNEPFLTAITKGQKLYFGNVHSSLDSLQLTEQKVEDWIKARIEVAKLQNKMKANAADYNNVVHSFFEERKFFLESLGWSVQEFDEAKERIQAAVSAMDIADEMEADRADHEKQISEIKASEFYSDQQKKDLIKSMEEMRLQKMKLYINPTKKDWPAVEPYRDTIAKMSAWIAGNIPNPPNVE